MSEPFWCEELGKHLQIIPNEEADRICKDVQTWCTHIRNGNRRWVRNRTPEWFRHPFQASYSLPSNYTEFAHAIEVHVGKPEYDPPTSST